VCLCVYSHFRSSELLNELCVKSQSDLWIVGRRSDQREFYVILNKKDATLIDISGMISFISPLRVGFVMTSSIVVVFRGSQEAQRDSL